MEPDAEGRYPATNEKTVLKYNGEEYILHTCCKMCSVEMNKIAKTKVNLINYINQKK